MTARADLDGGELRARNREADDQRIGVEDAGDRACPCARRSPSFALTTDTMPSIGALTSAAAISARQLLDRSRRPRGSDLRRHRRRHRPRVARTIALRTASGDEAPLRIRRCSRWALRAAFAATAPARAACAWAEAFCALRGGELGLQLGVVEASDDLAGRDVLAVVEVELLDAALEVRR